MLGLANLPSKHMDTTQLHQQPTQDAQQQPSNLLHEQIINNAYKDGIQAEISARKALSSLCLITSVPVGELFSLLEAVGRLQQLNTKLYNSISHDTSR